MHKFMILTDSNGFPRSFPPSEVFELEETYPYLIRNHFKSSIFWQLSYGGIITPELVSQPISYLSHWNPDIIIVQSGTTDCRPEAFTDFQKTIINKLSGPFFGKITKYVYHPGLIKRRQVYRVSKTTFRRTIKKFKRIFPQSKILWIGICAGPRYEQSRPGFNKRVKKYNWIIKQVYGEDFVPLQKKMQEADGFNHADHFHWNKKGHQVVADLLIERINSFLEAQETQKECLHE